MKQLFRILSQGPVIQVPGKDGVGQTSKCTVVLQELGGKYEDSYAVTLFGNMAQCRFSPGEVVYAVLRFQAHEYNGQWYQDAVAKEIMAFSA